MCARIAVGRPRTSSRASSASNRSPRNACVGAAKLRKRTFSGSEPASAAAASTTTSSTRSASARTIAAAAPSVGCAGSTCCVTKTSLLTCADPRRARACGRRTPRASAASARRTSALRRRAARRASRSERMRTSASASARASPGGTSRPLAPSSTMSGMPPARLPTTGLPRANASIATRGEPFRERRQHERSRSVERGSDLRRLEPLCPRRLLGKVAHELLDELSLVSAPDDPQRRAGHLRRGETPRVDEPLHVLVALEHADEERRRLFRQRNDRTRGERRDVEVRRERRHRLDPELPHEVARERRDRAHRIGMANRSTRRAPADRLEQAPQRRSVEARRGVPVAVHLQQHARTAPREPAPGQDAGRFVRALRDHDLRSERAQLAGDPQGKPEIERRRAGGNELETPVVDRAVCGAREDAQLELVAERIPLACERRVEREPVARATDEEDAGLAHVRAAAISTCSRRPKIVSRS